MSSITNLIRQIVQDNEEIYSKVATVTEIDEAERTVTVSLNDGSAEVFDVRLQSMVSGLVGVVNFPKLQSEVLVSFISKNVAYIALFGEIEKVLLKIGDLEFFVDATNFNATVENIDIVSKKIDAAADDIKINATNTELDSDDIKINASTVKVVSTVSFEVQGANIKLNAPLVDIIAGAINLSGAVTIAGAVSIAGAVAINGGANGGLPMGAPLVAKLNKLESTINSLKTKISSWSPVANDGGTALKAALTSWNSPAITPTTVSEISNPQITQ